MRAWLPWLLLLLWACDQKTPPGPPPPPDPPDPPRCDSGSEPLYPLEQGAWWRYRVIDPKTSAPQCPDKVVSVAGPPQAVPGRPDVLAFRVRSEREDAYGFRWQEVLDDGSVVRHLDEWFDVATDRHLSMEYFCEPKLRVPQNGKCERDEWDEEFQNLVLTPTDGTDWSACEHIELDGCDVTVAPGCEVLREHSMKHWEILEAAARRTLAEDGIEVPDAANPRVSEPFEALRLVYDESFGDDPDAGGVTFTSEFWWVHGVGKIHETGGEDETEWLVDYCLRSDGCERLAPTRAELIEEQGCSAQ